MTREELRKLISEALEDRTPTMIAHASYDDGRLAISYPGQDTPVQPRAVVGRMLADARISDPELQKRLEEKIRSGDKYWAWLTAVLAACRKKWGIVFHYDNDDGQVKGEWRDGGTVLRQMATNAQPKNIELVWDLVRDVDSPNWPRYKG